MTLSELDELFNQHQEPAALSEKLGQFISKYKNKIDTLSQEQVYELIEHTEIFKYCDSYESCWLRTELAIQLQKFVALEIYDKNEPPDRKGPLALLIVILMKMQNESTLNKENFFAMRGKGKKSEYLGRGLIALKKAKLYTPENRNKIITLYDEANSALDILHNFNNALNEMRDYYYHYKMPKQELFDLLIQHPKDAHPLQQGIQTLANANVLNKQNLEIILNNRVEAQEMARGLVKLVESKLDTTDNIKTIQSNPVNANQLAESLKILHQAGLLNDTYRTSIAVKFKDCFLFPSLLRSLSDNNLLHKKNVELIFNADKGILDSIYLWIFQLNQSKLLNQSNFINLLQYWYVFCKKGIQEKCHLLLNPKSNCYRASQHLLINLTQEILDIFFKFCQEGKAKSIEIDYTIFNITQHVAELNEKQNGWYYRLASKIENIKYLFEDLDKNQNKLPCPWYFENRKAMEHIKRLLFGLGEECILNKGSKTACFDCVIDFLNKRWNLIKETPLAYPYSLSLPITKICIALADAVASELKISRYKLLMPSIDLHSVDLMQCEPTSQTIEHKELQLHQFILDDKNQRPIYVLGSLDSAKEDGILKHTHLFKNQAECLTEQETYRIAHHCPEAKKYYDIIKQMDEIRRKGSSIGSSVYRLITRVRHGGEHGDAKGKNERKGQELNSGADANEGIFEFNQLLNILNPEEKAWLFALKAPGMTDNFESCWARLARPESAEYERVIYCVELTANALENILNHNKDLFSKYPNNKQDQIKINVEILEREALEASIQLDKALSHIDFTPIHPSFTVSGSTPGFGQAAKLLWQRLLSNEQNWEGMLSSLPDKSTEKKIVQMMLDHCPLDNIKNLVLFFHSNLNLLPTGYHTNSLVLLDKPSFRQAFTEGYITLSNFLKLQDSHQDYLSYLFIPEGLEALKNNKITVEQFFQTIAKDGIDGPEYFNRYTFIALNQNLLDINDIIKDTPFRGSVLQPLYTAHGLITLQKKYIQLEHIKKLIEVNSSPELVKKLLNDHILSQQGFQLLESKFVSMEGWINAWSESDFASTRKHEETAVQKYNALESKQNLTCPGNDWYAKQLHGLSSSTIKQNRFSKLYFKHKFYIWKFLSPKNKVSLAQTNRDWRNTYTCLMKYELHNTFGILYFLSNIASFSPSEASAELQKDHKADAQTPHGRKTGLR